MKNLISKFVAACFVSLFSFSASAAYTYDLSELTFAIDNTDDGVENPVEQSQIDYYGYSMVLISDDNGDTYASTGDATIDYGYLLSNDTTIYATYENWTGEVVASSYVATGTALGTQSTITYEFDDDGTNTMTWYYDDGINALDEILTLTLTYGVGTLVDYENGGTINEIQFQFAITEVVMQDYLYLWIDGDWVDIYDVLYSGLYDDYEVVYALTVTTVEDDNLASIDDASMSDATSDLVALGYDYADYIGQTLLDYDENVIEDYDFVYVNSTDGNIEFAAQIPEPGTIGLMGLALFGLAGFQRRRNS